MQVKLLFYKTAQHFQIYDLFKFMLKFIVLTVRNLDTGMRLRCILRCIVGKAVVPYRRSWLINFSSIDWSGSIEWSQSTYFFICELSHGLLEKNCAYSLSKVCVSHQNRDDRQVKISSEHIPFRAPSQQLRMPSFEAGFRWQCFNIVWKTKK